MLIKLTDMFVCWHNQIKINFLQFNKALNSAKVREKVQTNHKASLLPGSPSQAGSKPGDASLGAPISLWPLGAAGVQIPLPAPIYQLELFLRLFCLAIK